MLRNISLEQLVIGFQTLVIVILVVWLLLEQLRRQPPPRELGPPDNQHP